MKSGKWPKILRKQNHKTKTVFKDVMQVCFIVILDMSDISLQQMESFINELQKGRNLWKNKSTFFLFLILLMLIKQTPDIFILPPITEISS